MLCYIFRGVMITFGISFIPYMFTIILFGIYFLKKECLNIDNSVNLFIFAGILMTFVSFFIIMNNSIVASVSGFLVTFINFILWVRILTSTSRFDFGSLFNIISSFIFFCAIISALLAVYQIFFDTSIFGLAQSGIYSDEDAMSSGKFQSRATALFSSAQNYGVFMGMSFCIALTHKEKNKLYWIIGLLIILVGIFVSNSRSASACVVIALTFGAFNSLRTSKHSAFIIFTYAIAAIILFIIAIKLINSEYALFFHRLLEFNNSESQIVYDSTMKQFDIITYLTGLGMGYRNWTVNSLLGPEQYRAAYGEAYYSVESYFLTLLVQGGLLLLLSIIIVLFKILLKSYKRGTLSIIACMIVNMYFTPSMSGMAISFIFWPYLLRELITDKAKVKR